MTLLALAAAPALAHADIEPVTRAGEQDATAVDASADGRFVVFESRAANLTEPDMTNRRRVYRRDVLTGRTTLVSRNPDGSRMAFDTQVASISGDGRRVAFAQATLGESERDCFVRDVEAHTTTVVTVSTGCRRPQLSADGRVLTYIRAGEDGSRAYVHDLATGEEELVAPLDAQHAAPSADGRYAVFDQGPTYERDRQVYVRDRVAQTTRLVSRGSGSAGAAGDAGAWGATISADGRFVGFTTAAVNLGGPTFLQRA